MELLPYQVVPDNWDQFYSEQVQHNLPDSLHSFYHLLPPDITQTMQATDFVALDIETTGMNALEDKIVSIGLVPFDYQRIYLANAKYWVVRSSHLTPESVVIHRITHTEVAEAPALLSVLPEIIAHLKGKQIVVHYRYMEREFLRAAVAELMQQNWLFPVIDTLELEAQYLRDKQSFIAGLVNKQLPSLRLPNARERYNLPAYENHNALVDALATAELLQAQMTKHKLADTPLRKLWN